MKVTFSVPALLAAMFLAGCKREGQETSQAGTNQKISVEPGTRGAESEHWGYLPLKIQQAHENQKLIDMAPWHASGGDWTFLVCEVDKQPSAQVLIGTRTRSTTRKDIPMSWGEAFIAVNDSRAGAAFVEAFSKAFHQASPSRYGDKPPGSLKMQTAVLGANQVRGARGGFQDGRKGTWTATKWFLQNDTAEAEVFFNYSVSDKRAEFSEKDEDYREALIEQLVIGLRDGPLPERTPENDPTLTLNGPQVVEWKQIAGTNETAQFVANNNSMLITASEEGKGSKLFLMPIAGTSERKPLADFEGSVLVHGFLSNNQGLKIFLAETLRKDPKIFSTADPQRLWLVDAGGKREVTVPASITNWSIGKGSISPDSQFLALHSWHKKPKQQNTRMIHIGDLQHATWKTVELPDTMLELVGWTGEKPMGIVLAGHTLRTDEKRRAFRLEPQSASLSPLETIPAEFDPDAMLSPGHGRSAAVQEKQGLVITELPGGQKRQFTFHPYDKRSAYRDSLQWVSDRYLVFQGPRTALIDAETLKMNFPVTKEAGFSSVEFSADFKWGLGTRNGGQYLGRVELPDSRAATK